MLIQNENGYQAELQDRENEVAVTIYRCEPVGWRGAKFDDITRPVMKRVVLESTLDCPFHVALDRVHHMLYLMERHTSRPST